MLKHLHVCNAALSNRVVQPSCESRQKHIYSKNGGRGREGMKQPMFIICMCKVKSMFVCDFVDLHHESVNNYLEYCFV